MKKTIQIKLKLPQKLVEDINYVSRNSKKYAANYLVHMMEKSLRSDFNE